MKFLYFHIIYFVSCFYQNARTISLNSNMKTQSIEILPNDDFAKSENPIWKQAVDKIISLDRSYLNFRSYFKPKYQINWVYCSHILSNDDQEKHFCTISFNLNLTRCLAKVSLNYLISY